MEEKGRGREGQQETDRQNRKGWANREKRVAAPGTRYCASIEDRGDRSTDISQLHRGSMAAFGACTQVFPSGDLVTLALSRSEEFWQIERKLTWLDSDLAPHKVTVWSTAS